ncbi:hypothetical protein [Methyloversatilis sp.]
MGRLLYGLYAMFLLVVSLAINGDDDDGGRSRSYSSSSDSGSSWGSGHK